MKLKNLPDFEELNDALSCYFEDDEDELQKKVFAKYFLSKKDIIPVPLRFVKNFIDSKASLYSNTFERTLNKESEKFDEEVFDFAMLQCERFLHLFKKSAILIGMDDDILTFSAIDPTTYYKEGNVLFIEQDDGSTILLVEGADYSVTEAYLCQKTLSEAVAKFDTELEGFGCNFEQIPSPYSKIPIVEWTKDRAKKPKRSSLVALERQYITQITWGLYNADPKLIHQVVLNTDDSPQEIKQKLKRYGKTTSVTVLSPNDVLKIFDSGDVGVLKDLFAIYEQILSQRAVQEGVDKNKVIPTSKIESGEAKKVELSYINKARADYMIPAKIFEKKIFARINLLYGIDLGWDNVVFRDIDLTPDAKTDAEFAIYMRDNGFWTYAESYAYVHQISVSDAEMRIKELGLTPNGVVESEI